MKASTWKMISMDNERLKLERDALLAVARAVNAVEICTDYWTIARLRAALTAAKQNPELKAEIEK